MTADRARKQAARKLKAVTGEPYNSARRRTQHPKLTAICDTCSAPVADGDGILWIPKADLARAEPALQAFKQQQTQRFVALSDYPELARWRVDHHACADLDGAAYAIELHRCRNWPNLINWTAHLMGKAWLSSTDWHRLLKDAVNAAGHRLNPTHHLAIPELTITCGTCHQPVRDREGALWVESSTLYNARTGQQEFERKRMANESVSIWDYPDSAEWRVDHYACTDFEHSYYTVDVHRCRTWRSLADWTAHLMIKGWPDHTDWDTLLSATTENTGECITPVTKPRLIP